MVANDAVGAKLFARPQFSAVLGVHLGKARQDLLLCFHGLDHEVAYVFNLCLHQRVGCGAAFLGDVGLGEVQLGNSAENRLVADHRGVLSNHDGCTKGGLVGVVAVGFDAARAQQTAAVEVLELIPFERFGVIGVGVAVSFEQYQGEVGHLAHRTATARCGAFGRVEALIQTPEQLPDELDQGGFPRVRFTRHFQERKAFVFGPDLFREQRPEPVR
ncbi:hypothetical protein D3C84_782280 [compost metagenome]